MKKKKINNSYNKIIIDKNVFKGKIDYIITSFKLKPYNLKEYEAYFTLYYGQNIMYCYLQKNYQHNSYELIFHNFNEEEAFSNIKIGNDVINKADKFDNTVSMKRFLLFNPKKDDIEILNQKMSLSEYIKWLAGNSFQLSFFSIEKKLIVSQEIVEEKNESIIELIRP